MHTSGSWAETIRDLQSDLAVTGRAIEATASDPRLSQLNNEKAVRIGYRLMAFELAEDLLIDLRADLNREVRRNDRDHDDNLQAVAQWVRTAVGTGLVAGLLTLVSLNFSVPWWLIVLDVLLVIACALSIVGAVGNHVSRIDVEHQNELSARVYAIESACERCTTAEDLAAVTAFLEPRNRKPAMPDVPTSTQLRLVNTDNADR